MNRIKYTFIITLLMGTIGCQEDWLDIKQDKQDVVPQTLDDLQALLDNSDIMTLYSTPNLGVLSMDNIFYTPENWAALEYPYEKNAYLWLEDIYEGNPSYNWSSLYEPVLYTNLALEGLEKRDPSTGEEKEKWNHIKGNALFHRSWQFFQVVQHYAVPYDQATAKSDLGIPLRLESDINLVSTRSSVQEVYDKIIKDTKLAVALLPESPIIKTRAGKAAANGLLAKIGLHMGNYSAAKEYAEAALDIQSGLLDYNELDTAADFPFSPMHEEVIYQSTMYPFSLELIVDPQWYETFSDNDWRKWLYFEQVEGEAPRFKGSYAGPDGPFSGIAVDELFLILAECEHRLGNTTEALSTLNLLLETRWKSGTFEPLAENDNLLERIIEERRKSLAFRGIRWMDMRRLNKEPDLTVTLERNIEGTTYVLQPNSAKYVLPIPDEVIMYSNMEQNPR